jgi:hypothetical protein
MAVFCEPFLASHMCPSEVFTWKLDITASLKENDTPIFEYLKVISCFGDHETYRHFTLSRL